MIETQQSAQMTHHSSGLWFVNLIISGAIAGAVGCLFDSIYLGVGLSFCFFLLFHELSRPDVYHSSSDATDLENSTSKASEKKAIPEKRRISWIRRDDRYYVPPHRTPGRITPAEFCLALEGRGPMGVYES